MRVFLLVIAAAFCGGVLCIPLRLTLSGMIEAGSGTLCLRVRWLLFRTNIRFDICLLDPPAMTVLIRHGRALTVRPIGGGRGEKPRFTETLRRAMRVKTLSCRWHVGVRSDPALSAVLGGLIDRAGRLAFAVYLPETAERLHTEIHPRFDRDMLRLSIWGIATAFPAQIIAARLGSRKRQSGATAPKKGDRRSRWHIR